MSKLNKFKQAIQSPPPERLAKIEYQSHFLQMLGVAVVCFVLIIKGLWYIIFAFIFSLGVSYSQGMSAYTKYRNILEMVKPEHPLNFEEDISPTRRRSKIINHVFGNKAHWSATLLSVGISWGIIPITLNRWLMIPAYIVSIPTIYILSYFFIFYWIAYPAYKREVKI